MILDVSTGYYKFLLQDTFKILGSAMSRQEKTYDTEGERMQSTEKSFWKDSLIYKSKDVPMKIKCQRLMDHVFVVFAFGSEKWSWSIQTMENIKG